ncbi:hypothetical protein [Candidatus Poriferisodalis sp.]|uniref:hypothetical protein n=1 Tax=Candidatus Poriferisodalis sp. TaxID=3101277 RepID=UPI003B59E316
MGEEWAARSQKVGGVFDPSAEAQEVVVIDTAAEERGADDGQIVSVLFLERCDHRPLTKAKASER